MTSAIELKHVGKTFSRINHRRYISLREIFSSSIRNSFKGRLNKKEMFWALKDINFTVKPGEKIGILGANGAGKSTLLKIISKITPPTTGEILIRGCVGSLLEVGTGFHPELSGRENIFLNGSILGLKKKEIKAQFDAIVDFSGVSPFIDSPLKNYSSGMQMRLAFSVASHLQADILLIDEVLAVGDLEFQQRCLGKMEEINREHGRTILFVSHNLSALGTLTEKSLYLKQGEVIQFDNTSSVISSYTKEIQHNTSYLNLTKKNTPSIQSISLKCSEGEVLQACGNSFSVDFTIYMPEEDTPNIALSFQVINASTMIPVLHYHIFDVEIKTFRKKGLNKLQFTSSHFRLFKGRYFLRVYLAESKIKVEYDRIDCCSFQVEMIGWNEIEWGWSDNMCQYLDEGQWIIE